VWPVAPERDYRPMAVDVAADLARIVPTTPLPMHPEADRLIVEARRHHPNAAGTELDALRTALRPRPNVLMFGDPDFDWSRAHAQDDHFSDWKEELLLLLQQRQQQDHEEEQEGEEGAVAASAVRVCVVEIGAGQSVRTIKDLAESELAAFPDAKFIRINYSEADGLIPERVDDY
jgi:hypothetical protein